MYVPGKAVVNFTNVVAISQSQSSMLWQLIDTSKLHVHIMWCVHMYIQWNPSIRTPLT